MKTPRILTMIQILATLAVAALVLGLFVMTSRGMPDNAIVFMDDEARTYLAPPCVKEQGKLSVGTAGQARGLKYRPDRKCRDEGSFIQDDRSLTGLFLEKIGILEPIPSRWNADGTWNY